MNIMYLDALPGLRTDIDDELGGDEKGFSPPGSPASERRRISFWEGTHPGCI